MKIAQYGLIVSLLSGAAVMACGSNGTQDNAGARADQVSGGANGGTSDMNASGSTSNGSTETNGTAASYGGLTAAQMRSPAFAVCSDSEVASIMRASDQSEILLVSGLIDRFTNADVRAFAQRLLQDHTQSRNQLDQLIRTRNFVYNEDNGLVREILGSAQLELTHLQTMSGEELDRSFVDHEVVDHIMDIGMTDHLLLPSAKDPQLVQQAVTGRAMISAHAQLAVQVQTRLEGACAGPATTDGGTGTTDGGTSTTDGGGNVTDGGGGGTTDAECDAGTSNNQGSTDAGHEHASDAGRSNDQGGNNECDGGSSNCPSGSMASSGSD